MACSGLSYTTWENHLTELKWWQKAVFYQIYPRSFADGNGDGIGDFPGMIDRLDYLKDLGVDAVWLSPHYPSPQFDCGYDVADYAGVAPEYGTLDDFQRFLDGAHARGIRVILDMVLNHTSDQHPWFLESRSSRDNPKRDWYIWRDPTPRRRGAAGRMTLPNNWNSRFGGSVWEYDSKTGQYYYHSFFKEQPDLNWRNPEVKQAVWNMARFWLERGVDGFRLDALGGILKDLRRPNHSVRQSATALLCAWLTARTVKERKAVEARQKAMFQYQSDLPEVHETMCELRAMVDEYADRMFAGETDNCLYYGNGNDELHLVFNFPLMERERLTPAWVRANQKERLAALPPGAWPCNTLGNHDRSRVYSRCGDGRDDDALARLSLALMLTLRGTPFLYNGEEIGMTDMLLDDFSLFRDNTGIWYYAAVMEELGMSPAEALALANHYGRDKCRTPMQWANAPNAGFSPPGTQTWLPVNPNYAQGVNVADQLADPDSLLNFYRRMLRLRRQTPALIAGDYTPLHEEAEDYLALLRCSDEQTCLVVLNLSEQAHTLRFDLGTGSARRLFSSQAREATTDNLLHLAIAPWEVYIAEVT